MKNMKDKNRGEWEEMAGREANWKLEEQFKLPFI